MPHLTLIRGSYRWKEKSDSCKLSSDLHRHAVAYASSHTHIQMEFKKKKASQSGRYRPQLWTVQLRILLFHNQYNTTSPMQSACSSLSVQPSVSHMTRAWQQWPVTPVTGEAEAGGQRVEGTHQENSERRFILLLLGARDGGRLGQMG